MFFGVQLILTEKQSLDTPKKIRVKKKEKELAQKVKKGGSRDSSREGRIADHLPQKERKSFGEREKRGEQIRGVGQRAFMLEKNQHPKEGISNDRGEGERD